MDWIARLSAVVDYVEGRLDGEISPKEAGKVAGMSPFHFQRTFSVIAGIPFAEYVRRRRLTLAAREIAEGEGILDTAIKYGWESQAAFTRSFKALHGITPGSVRDYGVTIKAYPPLSFQFSIQGAESMDYEIRKTDTFTVVGMQKAFTSKGGANFRDIPEFWHQVMRDGSFGKMISKVEDEGLTQGGSLGICFDDDGGGENFNYMIGMIPKEGADCSDYVTRKVPAHTWAIFKGSEALPDGIQLIWKAIFAEWFPATEYEHAAGPEIELYCDPDKNAGKMSYEIWIPVKKA